MIHALTSLSPTAANEARQKACILSWHAAGLHPISFNHPTEIPALRSAYDIELVPVAETTEAIFRRPFVPIRTMLRHAEDKDSSVLLINADIELQLLPWELERLRLVADEGLCYFVRHNHDGDPRRAKRELLGIDAFLLHGRHASLFPDSFLSMGQPLWDYWLPHMFAAARRPVFAVEYPAAFHLNHQRRWSNSEWHRCALEFGRVTGALGADRSVSGCAAMSRRIRLGFDRERVSVPQKPTPIRDWVMRRFGGREPKVFMELGSHQGTDTAWLAELPGVVVHAFEPDPRNEQPSRPNVICNRAAIAERDGRTPFILSRTGWNHEWTYSSSTRAPKHHLERYPVSFGETIEVEAVSLDSYKQRHRLDVVDFIWADIQGAEGDMARGGRELLSRTRYLYTEYSNEELYEGQATLPELLGLLPGFRVVELYENDVLLENTALARAAKAPSRPKFDADDAPPTQHEAEEHAVISTSGEGEPLVTCIMPTFNRRAYVRQAIHYFQRQDYPNLELLVLDDGTDPVGDCMPQDPRVRYARVEGKHTIGAKRNMACQAARGEIIAHWDDDDWYPAGRIRSQVKALEEGGTALCGTSQEYFYAPKVDRAWLYRWRGVGRMLVGSSLLYRKNAWARSPFPDIQLGEDVHFVRAFPGPCCDLADPRLGIGIIHPGNTSRKVVRGAGWSPGVAADLRTLLGEDLEFYRSWPLVSCVMPTFNRGSFVPLSIRNFLQQDYPNKELLIVDDGTEPVAAAAEGAASVRYFRLPMRQSIGYKRNFACAEARGEIIAHWDDDDWYGPDRLRRQVAPIAVNAADVTGLESRFVLELSSGSFWSAGRELHRRPFVGDVNSRTLVFRKAIWSAGVRYPNTSLSEDGAFLQHAVRRGRRLARITNDGDFVYVRHGGNTRRFELGDSWLRVEQPASFTPETLADYTTAAGGA